MSVQSESAFTEYIEECQEMLDRIALNIEETEKKGFHKETVASIYRDIHTIKGSAQLFGFSKMGNIAHIMESCLDPLRKEKIKLSQKLLDSIYIGIDFIIISLENVKKTKKEPIKDGQLNNLFKKFISSVEEIFTNANDLTKDKEFLSEELSLPKNSKNLMKEIEIVTSEISKENPGFGLFDDVVKPTISESPSIPTKTAEVTKTPLVSSKNLENENKKTEDLSNNQDLKKSTTDEQFNETIRVQVGLLNSLMNLVGELVLIRNQLLEHAKSNDEDPEFLKMSQRLNILTAELQNEVMKTRMQPIGNILTVYSRVVRDLSRELGKKIELQLIGIETELDKTVIEAVKDPLMHIVRNAIDHGIENSEDRKKAGKKETALIQIKAYNENGQVIIEIIDDGRGLDLKRISEKAVEKAIISSEQVSKMSEKEIQLLIFSPGFSTAASISNISGRGVGMDVVKTNVEKIGGVVDLISTFGLGTTIIIKIPLSLAILPALIVKSHSQRFAIPQTKLVELLRIDGTENTSEKIEPLQGNMVFRLRGKLIPIISLSEALFNKKINISSINENVTNVVILNADNFLFGLIVDEIDDSADIVVKPLSQFLKYLKVFSGASIMGDGSVALTIDVLGLAEKAHLAIESLDTTKQTIIKSKISNYYHLDICEYLLIDVGSPSSYGIPLSIVNRIEEFDNSSFEYSGEQKVIRYRDSLLPIFSLPDFLKLTFDSSVSLNSNKTPIIVIKRGELYYGIEVLAVYDIIEISTKINQTVKDRVGILGTVSINDRIIVIADIFGMIENLKEKLTVGHSNSSHDIKENEKLKDVKNLRSNHRILFAEDSSFFRNYIKTVLEDSGYTVETAYDGSNALEILESSPSKHFSFILSDIEMPTMDGLEFARRVKLKENLNHIPMFAITTKYSQVDIDEGKKAGFLKYLEKLNAEKLISEIDSTILNSKNEDSKNA